MTQEEEKQFQARHPPQSLQAMKVRIAIPLAYRDLGPGKSSADGDRWQTWKSARD